MVDSTLPQRHHTGKDDHRQRAPLQKGAPRTQGLRVNTPIHLHPPHRVGVEVREGAAELGRCAQPLKDKEGTVDQNGVEALPQVNLECSQGRALVRCVNRILELVQDVPRVATGEPATHLRRAPPINPGGELREHTPQPRTPNGRGKAEEARASIRLGDPHNPHLEPRRRQRGTIPDEAPDRSRSVEERSGQQGEGGERPALQRPHRATLFLWP